MIYEPPPARTPLLLRTASWSQGVPVSFLILTAILAIPGIFGLVLIVWAVDGVFLP